MSLPKQASVQVCAMMVRRHQKDYRRGKSFMMEAHRLFISPRVFVLFVARRLAAVLSISLNLPLVGLKLLLQVPHQFGTWKMKDYQRGKLLVLEARRLFMPPRVFSKPANLPRRSLKFVYLASCWTQYAPSPSLPPKQLTRHSEHAPSHPLHIDSSPLVE